VLALLPFKPTVLLVSPVSLALPSTLVEAAERAGVPLQVGFHRRFDPDWVAAATRIHAGDLGDVRVGKLIHVRLEAEDQAAAAATVQQMGEKLLANPVIETFEFSVIEAAAPAP